MTADSPASGLPQEAVDEAADAHAAYYDMVLETEGRLGDSARAMHAALTAALPFLRQQWEAELPDPNGLAHLRTANALFEERAKVAALQQAVDKVRALHVPYKPAHWAADEPPSCAECADTCMDYPCPTVALLPDAQADDRGTATPTPATTCADCGTTRTICDAGLNTYDSRCCGQCGHGAA